MSWLDDMLASGSGNLPGTSVTGPYIPPGVPDDLAIRSGGQLTNVPYGPVGPPSYVPPPEQVWDPSIQSWVTPGGRISLTDAQQALLDAQSGSGGITVPDALGVAGVAFWLMNTLRQNPNLGPQNISDSDTSGSAGGADYGPGFTGTDWGSADWAARRARLNEVIAADPLSQVSPFDSNDPNYSHQGSYYSDSGSGSDTTPTTD